MTYVMSDIHGEYEQFIELLHKINFSKNDTLYILGDVLDCGDRSIDVLLYMMKNTNIIPVIGNHELMGYDCLRYLSNQTQDNAMEVYCDNWYSIGGRTTATQFVKESRKTQMKILNYLSKFLAYKELAIDNKEYVLVHAGLGIFSHDKPMWRYTVDELVWKMTDYKRTYFKEKIIITGHIPTMNIIENTNPGYIYRAGNNIAIDCGAVMGGRLSALCLETNEEFYSKD